MGALSANHGPSARCAYVTLVTNEDYTPGAIALINSLRFTQSHADIVILYTDGVMDSALECFEAAGARPVKAQPLDVSDAFRARHQRDRIHKTAPFLKGAKPNFHTPLDNFCKLRLWQMEEYEACVFIDADAIVLRNIDVLFEYPEFAAAPNVYETLTDFHRLNSGVFTAKPSQTTFDSMMTALDAPDAFWRRTDQTFLEAFFPGWHGLPVFFNLLQYVWFNLPELWDWRSVRVIHYQYEKPWQENHPKAERLGPLIDLWRALYENKRPDVSALANPTS